MSLLPLPSRAQVGSARNKEVLCSVGDDVLFRYQGRVLRGCVRGPGALVDVDEIPPRPVTITVRVRRKGAIEPREAEVVISVGAILHRVPRGQ